MDNQHHHDGPIPNSPQESQLASIENKELASPTVADERHSRKCQVCKHPEREAIEEQFVNWERPTGISRTYEIPWKSLYRHAHAVGLVQRRRNNLRSVLDNILERGVEADITGDTVLKALRAYSCLTENNKWVEPATQVVFSTKKSPELAHRATLTLSAMPQMANTIDVLPEATESGASYETTNNEFLIDTPAD